MDRLKELKRTEAWKNLCNVNARLQRKAVVSTQKIERIFASNIGYKQDNDFSKFDLSAFRKKDRWGGARDTHHLFYFEISCPCVDENHRCFVQVETGRMHEDNPQFMVYENGTLLQGLDAEHREFPLEAGEHQIYLYAYNGPHALVNKSHSLQIELRVIDKRVEKLYYDFAYLLEWLEIENKNTVEYCYILETLQKCVAFLDFSETEETGFIDSVLVATEFLESKLYTSEDKNDRLQGRVALLGGAHIDVGWLWPVRMGAEKAQHTASTILALMEEYPEFRFVGTQPALYEFIKQKDPCLFEKIRGKVKSGEWEAEGAMWVQPDCNLTSGESLIRQLLYGKAFFKEEFDVESSIAWLPDSFGFSASLPQILAKSEIKAFITSKLTWADTNVMPEDVFNWVGIDGTEILSCLMPTQGFSKDDFVNYTAYGGELDVKTIQGTYERFRNKELYDEAMLTYGYGDGGGGPTRAMLEIARRAKSLSVSAPHVEHKTANEYIDGLTARLRNKKVPVWNGELYLEKHRGVYTTQAKMKRYNRKSEFLLQNAELASVLAEKLLNKSYDTQTLNEAWKKLLQNQFHDILPGSSIEEVYRVAEKEYDEIQSSVGALYEQALEEMANQAEGEGVFVFNPSPYETGCIACIDGDYKYIWDVPAKGYAIRSFEKAEHTVRVSKNCIENDILSVQFNEDGDIVSVWDKREEREVVKKDRAVNKLCVYDDYPYEFDAWEIKAHAYEKTYPVKLLSMTPFTEGGRAGYTIKKRIGKSVITQKISLFDGFSLIDFETEVEWHETHVMLKAHFPFELNASLTTSDIQFGYVERNIHSNTSWDSAKFEICAQKYLDVSEGNYGVAILNDCKYGYGVKDGEVNLSLLRSPTYPDETADKGKHVFRYALYAHCSSFRDSKVEKMAYLYNNPPIVVSTKNLQTKNALPKSFGFIRCADDNIVVDTVKKAESGNGYIVRLYESKNSRTKTALQFGVAIKEAWICNLMEKEETLLPIENNTVNLTVKPFEIITLKLL